MSIEIQIARVRDGFDDLPLPSYATSGAAGMDLRAALDESLELAPGERASVPTGLALALPEGFECQIRPRSGLAARYGLGMVNAPGTIDEDYRGEIRVLLINHGQQTVRIERGERIAQAVIARYERAELSEVASLPQSDRGTGGFGSTGRR